MCFMKVLTIKQPWASLIINEYKKYDKEEKWLNSMIGYKLEKVGLITYYFKNDINNILKYISFCIP